MQLKLRDTLLVLKHWSVKQRGEALLLCDIAERIGVSGSEASKGNKRLLATVWNCK
jgi:hypothetical protein